MKIKNVLIILFSLLVVSAAVWVGILSTTSVLTSEKALSIQTSQGRGLIQYLTPSNIFNSIYNLVKHTPDSSNKKTSQPKEIKKILKTNDLNKQVTLYKELIERIGLIEAQDALYQSGLPFNGQTHLLNHTSGDAAYEEYGNKGILFCKDYFLQSCYHGVTIAAIANENTEVLGEIMKECWDTGGEAVAIQCAHGIGHGLVAWFDYSELPKALEECDKIRDTNDRFPIFNCYDGAFMENLWGVHTDGTPSPDRWIRENDPYYPCYAPEIKEKWRQGCWSNQASVMYQNFEGDYAKVSEFCEKVPEEGYRIGCQDNLARQIHSGVGGSVERAFELCNLLGEKWNNFCLQTLANSEYSVGGRALPFQICSKINTEAKGLCYSRLINAIQFYNNKIDGFKECGQILEEKYKEQCKLIIDSQF